MLKQHCDSQFAKDDFCANWSLSCGAGDQTLLHKSATPHNSDDIHKNDQKCNRACFDQNEINVKIIAAHRNQPEHWILFLVFCCSAPMHEMIVWILFGFSFGHSSKTNRIQIVEGRENDDEWSATTSNGKSGGFVQRVLNIYEHSLSKSLIYRSCFPNQTRPDYILIWSVYVSRLCVRLSCNASMSLSIGHTPMSTDVGAFVQ